MLVKGIIKSINLLENNCWVELPTFEKDDEEVIIEAIFSIPPGSFNGYAQDDVVIVGFECDRLTKPIVIGKLFSGKETGDTGAILCSSLQATNSAEIPGETKLIYNKDIKNNFAKYKTIADIVSAVNKCLSKIDNSEYSSQAQKMIKLKYRSGNLKILLYGFDKNDVGGKICLMRTKRKGNKGYSHPANLVEKDGSNMGLGYAIVAGKKPGAGGHFEYFPEVPSWMPNNGFVQTEWTVTDDILKKGYIEIPLLSDWRSMLCCTEVDNEIYWSQIIGCSTYGTHVNERNKNGAMKFKFAFKPVSNDNIFIAMSSDTLYFGLTIHLPTEETIDDKFLGNLNHNLYISIK